MVEDLRDIDGRVANVIWINPRTQAPEQAPMMLALAGQHVILNPLMGTAPLSAGQFVRVAVVDQKTNLNFRFNARVVAPQGGGLVLDLPAGVERDRRQDFERVAFQGPLSIKRPFESEWHPAKGINLSANGLSFATPIVFSPDERIRALLTFSPHEQAEVAARVVRQEKQLTAVALDAGPSSQSILAYLRRYQLHPSADPANGIPK